MEIIYGDKSPKLKATTSRRTPNTNFKTMKNLSAKSIVEKIKSKEISSREATEYFIDKIEEVNPAINAVVVKRYEAALKEADQADKQIVNGETNGRLHGLPFTIKECFDLTGTPSTLGLERRKNDFPKTTDPYISKLQSEGGIVIGKTNVPQILMCYESENPVYGVTKNPHNPAHVCGGSSGGEGAIIAAGGSPLGIGSDIGGSLRSPAVFCGIKSIKPTMWRTVDHTRFLDYIPEIAINSVTGVMGNYVEDLDMMLQIMNEQAMTGRNEVRPLGNMNEVDVTKLKVGYFISDGLFEPMPAVKRTLMEAVEKLKSNGVNVFEWTPPNLTKAEELFFKILSADDAYLFKEPLGKEKPIPQIEGLIKLSNASPLTRNLLSGVASTLGQKGMKRFIKYFGGKGEEFRKQTENELEEFRRNFLAQMKTAEIDAILSPPCALPAYLHRTSDKVGLGGMYMAMYNVLGFPAGVVTTSKVKPEEAVPRKKTLDIAVRTAAKIEASSSGLPLAIQIAAKPWQEHIVFALMQCVQNAK